MQYIDMFHHTCIVIENIAIYRYIVAPLRPMYDENERHGTVDKT